MIDPGGAPSSTACPAGDRWIFPAAAALALALVGWAVVRAAWLSDDAYITLRTLDNFSHGYGLCAFLCVYLAPPRPAAARWRLPLLALLAGLAALTRLDGLLALYERVALLSRAPLWAPGRLRAILAMLL